MCSQYCPRAGKDVTLTLRSVRAWDCANAPRSLICQHAHNALAVLHLLVGRG
ncbi:hypothetical protein BAUCODRAFT_30572 [Baudoinia panamericana UAMH 10762]|uniref:Uncharacterized protein n=1 Tax=Baudoinia panamericana (strain UAMH 10762) TaxID=717646 RepID=M2MTA1_BAUPA|nr:uncharacterized protein BAUCODRAFT_30572 [Baudoinia panamericana UAMH 10762]EMD00112.1 hypothetical protein BAUCODRAFT_30572 [Baudoinia panamericana UAMH 10762]